MLTLTSVSPNFAVQDSGNTIVTLAGTGFTNTTVAQFSGVAIPTTILSAISAVATIPAVDLLSPGTFAITMFTPAPAPVSSGSDGGGGGGLGVRIQDPEWRKIIDRLEREKEETPAPDTPEEVEDHIFPLALILSDYDAFDALNLMEMMR